MKMKKIKLLVLLVVFFLVANVNAQTAYITDNNDSTVTVINVATNTVTNTIRVGYGSRGVSVSLDGSKVYVANYYDNTVSVINTTTNTVVATIPVSAKPLALVVTPDGSKVYVTNDEDSSLTVINTSSNTVSTIIHLGLFPDGAEGVCVSPDGSKVYVTCITNSIIVINTATNTILTTIVYQTQSNFSPNVLAISPDGSKLYVGYCVGNFGSRLYVINTVTNIYTDSIPVNCPMGLCVSPDGSKIYVSNNLDGSVNVINTVTNTVTDTIPLCGGAGISITPDGSKVYAAVGNIVSIINTVTNSVSATIPLSGISATSYGNFISTYTPPCSAIFSLYPDTTTLHHYIAINYATGIPPLHYLWNWGDGNTDTTATPSHTYLDSGIYTICLTITDSTGCTSTFCDSSYHIMRTSNYMVYVNVVAAGINNNISQPFEVKVFPNPANNSITFHSNSQLSILNSQLII